MHKTANVFLNFVEIKTDCRCIRITNASLNAEKSRNEQTSLHKTLRALMSFLNLTSMTIVHSTTHPFNHSSIQPPIHSTTHPFNHPSIQPLIHSTTHPFNHSSIQPLIHSFTHPFNHSSIQPPIHSTTHPFNHPSIHSTTHPFNHSSIQPPIHSTTHPFNHPSTQPSIHPQQRRSVNIAKPRRLESNGYSSEAGVGEEVGSETSSLCSDNSGKSFNGEVSAH